MLQQTSFRLAVMLFPVAMTIGCMPKMDIETIKQSMPQRPAELDQLESLVGRWDTTGEINIAVLEEPLKSTGSGESRWALDKRLIIEDAEFEMDELGKMKMLAIWGWDAKKKKYRTWWFDSMGEVSSGTATYHKPTRTWHMKSWGNKNGHTVLGKGTVKEIDDNTVEWTWNEYGLFGLVKFAEMKGVSKRK